ncbi:hypothetical protein HY745_03020 [Candidatus Desantisbacteria bacterium]|nr:hypothetical protein [Candidatus Desantisbacteria bacterium]
MNSLINNGIIILNKNNISEGKPTVIVLGFARSGTTMTASVLQAMGVFMGGKNAGVVIEDPDVFNILENKDRIKEFRMLVEKRNQEHDIWGWKRPRTIDYTDLFIDKVRNPHLIFMFRDALAIAVRNQIAIEADVLATLKDAQRGYTKLIDFVTKTKLPCMLASYEKAILKKSFFVQSLADFVGIHLSKEQLTIAENAIILDKKEYIESARLIFYTGVLDNVKNGIISGWAKRKDESNPVSINIIVNNKVVITVIADKYRNDLEKNGIGNGKHAFSFNLTPYLPEKKKYTIQAKVSESDYELRKSPWEINLTKT